ncbi:hypothetical protein I7I51_08553 [Histoplasma capsulatum]|uniref:Uncharacterized protein n=1 Tax=Ajellomyces capsulatus TaxID=5037 RepID=A0A8A1LZE9_AJECA|nr:hypothetical protein I7I51_08553 [Histoplasma capsulatum]
MAAAQQAGGAPPSGYPGGPPPVGGAPRPGAYPGQTQQYQAYPGPQAAVPPPALVLLSSPRCFVTHLPIFPSILLLSLILCLFHLAAVHRPPLKQSDLSWNEPLCDPTVLASPLLCVRLANNSTLDSPIRVRRNPLTPRRLDHHHRGQHLNNININNSNMDDQR